MNIFILSTVLRLCAQYHADIHVNKMIIESVQILCTCHRLLDNTDSITLKNGYRQELYKATHKHHPCVVWAMASSYNYIWLYLLFIHLSDEYTYRYNKTHLCDQKFRKVLCNIPKGIPDIPMTPFAIAMPEECKVKTSLHTSNCDAVESYRNYYNTHKRSSIPNFGKWKNRPIPEFYKITATTGQLI